MRKNFLLVAMMTGTLTVGMLMSGAGAAAAETGAPEMDASDFVSLAEAVPDVILEIRYYSTYNFVGDRIDGYEEPCALTTKEAAEALKGVAEDAQEQGYIAEKSGHSRGSTVDLTGRLCFRTVMLPDRQSP